MVKTNACRRAIWEILQMLVDDQQIDGDFQRFIDQCLSDYFYYKKLDYSLTSALRFREWVNEDTLKELIEIIEERLKDNAENTNEVNKMEVNNGKTKNF